MHNTVVALMVGLWHELSMRQVALDLEREVQANRIMLAADKTSMFSVVLQGRVSSTKRQSVHSD